MKRTLILIPAAIMAVFAPAADAQDYTWTDNGDGTCTITKYTGPSGDVVIPDTLGGLTVTIIGEYSFYLRNLTGVTIPDNITTIEPNAFFYCTKLTNVTIGNSVTAIGDGAFAACTSLLNITVDSANPEYISISGVLFNKTQTKLIQYPPGKAGTYIIPDTVTIIGHGAFAYNTSLTGVFIPDSVTDIKYAAFYACSPLTSIVIPDSVIAIDDWALAGCPSLMDIAVDTANPTYSSISGVLYNKDQTQLIQYPTGKVGTYIIPDSVITIGYHAFCLCTSLAAITIPDSVTVIGEKAFSGCTGLTDITIPYSVTIIGDLAFSGCASILDITVDTANPMYSSISGVLFNKAQTQLIQYPAGKAGTLIIPDSVTTIEHYAFYECTCLTEITIPDSVTTIGYGAFYYCTSLSGIYCKGDAPSLGSSVFSFNSSVMIYYIPGTEGWGTTYGGLPTAVWPPLAVDVDENYSVDLADFVVLAGQWLQTGCGEANGWCGGADFDRSGGVDAADLLLLADDWLWP